MKGLAIAILGLVLATGAAKAAKEPLLFAGPAHGKADRLDQPAASKADQLPPADGLEALQSPSLAALFIDAPRRGALILEVSED